MEKPLMRRFFLATCGLVILMVVNSCKKTTSTDSSVIVPVVITNSLISNLTLTSAVSGGIITNNGGGDIIASGICYSTTDQTPTTADTKTTVTGAIDAAGTISFTSTLSPLTEATTYYLRAYATNSAGTAYGSVVKFTTSSTVSSVSSVVSTLAGSSTYGFLNGSGTAALFNSPQGVANDAIGNVYVADGFNERIREITPGGTVSTFAGNGTDGFTNGLAANAEFYGPQGVATDANGNVYVADIGNNVIRKITAAGVVSTLAGNGIRGYLNGVDTVAEFNTPQALALDASGNVYVADRGNNVIRKITPAGVVTTFAGLSPATYATYVADGIATVGYSDGSGASVLFHTPKSIAVDASGNVYVADIGNYAIRKITPAGVVSTLAGGIVQTTIVGEPSGLAVDAKGNLFIADQGGRILEITSANVLYTIAGSSNTSGYVDGTDEDAKFNSPQGIAVDASGNIYVADFNNNVIRKIVVTIN